MVNIAHFFFCLAAKETKKQVETAFTHYFMLFAVAPRRHEGDFQRAEKQHKIVATAIFDNSKNSKRSKE
ncbi:MAG: hypothetical protein ACPG19_07415 [Saprospiraceae bacterium]